MKKILLAGAALVLMATSAHAHKKPLTPKQVRAYQAYISIGISKKEAKQAARDPGVKKGEWGWVCENPEIGKLIRIKGEGSKYKNNAVCE